MLSLGDVDGHPQHAFGLAVGAVIESASGGDPAHRAILPSNAEFCGVRLMAVHRRVQSVRDQSLVFTMHQTAEAPDIDLGRDSKHRSQIPKPGLAIAHEVPFPAHGLARLHCQAQPLVGEDNLLLRTLEIGHIDVFGDARGAITRDFVRLV